ncbi:MAG: hypothetical protein ABR543_02015 [Gemmatimonadaceae bacterium]
MSLAFVTSLRTNRDVVRVGPSVPGVTSTSVRVSIPELWETVRVEVAQGESVSRMKEAVLADLIPNADAKDYVLKLRGFEVLDESSSVETAGAVNGSTFLLTHRRRQAVR